MSGVSSTQFVVGVDGSATSAVALRWAAQLAASVGATMVHHFFDRVRTKPPPQ